MKGQLCAGDYLKVYEFACEISEDAISIICWINNHDKVRILFDKSQAAVSPDINNGLVVILSYLMAVITRWTTHATAFLRLLRLERAIMHAVQIGRNAIIAAQVGAATSTKKRRLEEDATKMCDLIEDRSGRFWNGLKTIVGDLEPICLATNINQKDTVRPDQVLLAFIGMYLHFVDHPEDCVRDGMVKHLEKRWKDCDQSLFLLALILNPFEVLTVFGPDANLSRFKLNDLILEVRYSFSLAHFAELYTRYTVASRAAQAT